MIKQLSLWTRFRVSCFQSSFNFGGFREQVRNDRSKSGVTSANLEWKNNSHSWTWFRVSCFQSSFNLWIPEQVRNDRSKSGMKKQQSPWTWFRVSYFKIYFKLCGIPEQVRNDRSKSGVASANLEWQNNSHSVLQNKNP